MPEPHSPKGPSASTRVTVPVVWAVTKVAALCGLDFGTDIAPLIASARPPALMMRGVTVTHTHTSNGWHVHEIASCQRSGRYVVAIHGGAFVVQPTIMHWLDYAQIARRTGAVVVVPMYPLARESGGNAAAVIPSMADFIAATAQEYGAANVSVYGDSAGGTIALAAVQELVRRADDASLPSSVVLLSPALDLTYSNPGITAVSDPVLDVDSLRRTGTLWASGLDLDDPRVSPINGLLDGLPPTAIYVGSREVMAPDVEKLRKLVAELGPSRDHFTFVRGEGQIHNWAQGGFSRNADARAVRQDVLRLLGLLDDTSKPHS